MYWQKLKCTHNISFIKEDFKKWKRNETKTPSDCSRLLMCVILKSITVQVFRTILQWDACSDMKARGINLLLVSTETRYGNNYAPKTTFIGWRCKKEVYYSNCRNIRHWLHHAVNTSMNSDVSHKWSVYSIHALLHSQQIEDWLAYAILSVMAWEGGTAHGRLWKWRQVSHINVSVLCSMFLSGIQTEVKEEKIAVFWNRISRCI